MKQSGGRVGGGYRGRILFVTVGNIIRKAFRTYLLLRGIGAGVALVLVVLVKSSPSY